MIRRRRHVGDNALDEAACLARDDFERFLPGVEPCEAQQILHQPLHPFGVPRDDFQEPPALVGARAAVGERFDVAANRRQRRAELVRDVGHEVAPDLIGAAQVGDVEQHEDHAVHAGACRWRGARENRARRIARR